MARPPASDGPRPGQVEAVSNTPEAPPGMTRASREASRGGLEGVPTGADHAPLPLPTPPTPGVSPVPSGTASEFVDAYLASKSELFRGSREVLRESFVPSRLPHREEQTRLVAEILAPSLRGDLPSNLLIYGKIGTGKTAVVAQVRQEIQRRVDVASAITFVTVNCGTIDTPYSLLQTIGNSFATSEPDRIPTGWSLDRVEGAMRRLMDSRGGTVILVLDEVDRLLVRSGDGVLYSLSQLNTELEQARVALVGISNDLKFTTHLDARVRSRLNEEKILFPPYNALQLQDILRDRAQMAFRENVLDAGVVERCAAYAALENGDARRALALLRLSAEMAERDRAKRITQDHVIKAKNRLEQDLILECCRTLPQHCKVLLYAILLSYEKRRASVLTGEVYESYVKLITRLGLPPLHPRSISNHISELESLGLVRATIVSKGRGGRSREILLDVPIQETLPALEDDPFLKPIARPRIRNQTLLTNFDNPARSLL